MSTFKVIIDALSKISVHPNADRLHIAEISTMTYQFCIKKDTIMMGQSVVYFPLDSVLPEPLIQALDLSRVLHGKHHNRVKTAVLRGVPSQGIVVPLGSLREYIEKKNPEILRDIDEKLNATDYTDPNHKNPLIGYDLTSVLEVVKYEPPVISSKAGNLLPHPEGISTYDIEGVNNYPITFERMLDMEVMVSEKLEGKNFYASILPDNKFVVGQRNFSIQEIEGHEHDFWKIARELNLETILRQIKEKLGCHQVSIRGEHLGPSIQDNIYRLSKRDVHFFDIMTDRQYMNVDDFIHTCAEYNLKTVPVLAKNVKLKDWLGTKTIAEAAHGPSEVFKDQIREGIVIKPMIETQDEGVGRLILKKRDPIYMNKYEK